MILRGFIHILDLLIDGPICGHIVVLIDLHIAVLLCRHVALKTAVGIGLAATLTARPLKITLVLHI